MYYYVFILWQPRCSNGAWQTRFIGFQYNIPDCPEFISMCNWIYKGTLFEKHLKKLVANVYENWIH